MKKIFVPSDFSKNATVALRYAIRLCKMMHADLVLFHCASLPPYLLSTAAVSDENMYLLTRDDEDYKLKKLQNQARKAYKYLGFKNIPLTTKYLVRSEPLFAASIIKAAEENHADLIVAGTHGATGFSRYLFGSNTANLIAKSMTPVLTIPEKYRFEKIGKITLASDLENISQELKKVIPVAKELKSSVDILYLDYGLDIDQQLVNQAEKEIKKSDPKKIRLVIQKASIEYSLIKQIKKYLAQKDCQWLLMFTKERKLWEKLFLWSKTENLSYTIKIPLLSFKKT